MTAPQLGPWLEREIRDLMQRTGLDHHEARKLVIATYLDDDPTEAHIRQQSR